MIRPGMPHGRQDKCGDPRFVFSCCFPGLSRAQQDASRHRLGQRHSHTEWWWRMGMRDGDGDEEVEMEMRRRWRWGLSLLIIIFPFSSNRDVIDAVTPCSNFRPYRCSWSFLDDIWRGVVEPTSSAFRRPLSRGSTRGDEDAVCQQEYCRAKG